MHFGQFLLADLLLTVPPRARPFVKVGGHVPPRALWSRRPCTRVEVIGLLDATIGKHEDDGKLLRRRVVRRRVLCGVAYQTDTDTSNASPLW